MALQIDGPTSGLLADAIANAFPNMMHFELVLGRKLNDSVWNYSGLGTPYPVVRQNFIQQYNARFHIDRLVVALLEQIPTNEALLKFAWDHQIVPRPAGDDALENMLDPVRGFSDPVAFLRRFGEIMNHVCQISVTRDDGIVNGTGFLIGDDTVITNYHVVEDVILKRHGARQGSVRLRFDYRADPDGNKVSDGVEFKLIDDETQGFIDHSPYHVSDTAARPIPDNAALDRPEDHLDYALMRVAGEPGKQRLGTSATDDGAVRGHLSLPEAGRDYSADFAKDSAAVYLFQHPSGVSPEPKILPLRLDWEKPAILGVNRNHTRVMYDVNTRKGSSGSPCFNAKLELIALHHAGGKDWPNDAQLLYNQGIPIGTIRNLLDERNKLGEIR